MVFGTWHWPSHVVHGAKEQGLVGLCRGGGLAAQTPRLLQRAGELPLGTAFPPSTAAQVGQHRGPGLLQVGLRLAGVTPSLRGRTLFLEKVDAYSGLNSGKEEHVRR